jgi:hypothetical protein
MKISNRFLIVSVLLLMVFGSSICVFAAEEASSIMCDNGEVNIGDMQTDVQDACGQPNSQNYEQSAWVYNFGPSQPVYTVFFKEGQVVKILEDEWGN